MPRFNYSFRPVPCRRWFLLTVAIISLLLAATIAVAEEKAESPAANPLVGVWQVQSLFFTNSDGQSEAVPLSSPRSCIAVFGDKTFTLRMGAEVISEMTYTTDSAKTPCTIDANSPDGPVLGVYERRGDGLKVNLNDKAKGRPADFDREHGNMFLILRRYPNESLFVINADGSGLRRLPVPREFTSTGSPDWSHDNRRIAYDSWRSALGEIGSAHAHVFVIDVDGGPPKDIGPGAMPRWSPDDKQLAFCVYRPELGLWLMNADGSGRKLMEPNAEGARWSPVDRKIVYGLTDGDTTNLYVYDVEKKERRALLDRKYREIYCGSAWSPDGKWIVFKGALPDGDSEIAAVSVEGEKRGFKVILPSSATPESGNCNSIMSWGGTGNEILVTMRTKDDRKPQFYLLDFTGSEPPRLLKGFPAHWESCDSAWSPDGKRMALTAVPAENPEKVEEAK